MPLRTTLLTLLLPAATVLALLILMGHPGMAITAALVTLAGTAMGLNVSREHLERQLRALTRQTRIRAEGTAPALEGERSEEVAHLEAAIDSLHASLTARNAVNQQEARTLAAVLDGMADGVWVTDAEGTVVRNNVALREMLQLDSAEIVGQRPLELIRDESLHEAVMRACREGATTELELTREGPGPKRLAVRVAPLGRGLPGSAAVFHDVSELRRLEKVRKDFVANVSHELRTPITAIRGYAETLQSGALSDPTVAPQMVEIIHRQSERLSEMVEELLELSRLEAREVKLQRTSVPLATVVERTAETVRPQADAKNITMTLHVAPDLLARGDERAVEQVLLNVLDNAVKYTPKGGRVDVFGAMEGGRCAVRVRDNGPGIEPKHLHRVFERFYRVDKGRSRDTGGTGLGLAIVKHLVEAMEGEVTVDSQPNEGSTFTIFLPAAAPQPGTSG